MADGSPVVGKDASVFTYAPNGADQAFGLGTATNMIARFKSISIKLEADWEDVTASSNGGLKERRKLNVDWSATAKSQIRTGQGGVGAVGAALMLTTDTVQVIFTEVGTGKTWTLYGGLKSAEPNYERGEAEETMEIINIGPISPDGTGSIFYE